ncbi:MAG: glycosyltransferase family 4 protein [Desulfobacterales bacterium]
MARDPHLKIVFLADVSAARVIGGAERVLAEEARGLARRGHRVTVLCRAPGPAPTAEEELAPGLREIRCPFAPRRPHRLLSATWPAVRRTLSRLRRHGGVDCLDIHQPIAAFGAAGVAFPELPAVYTCHSLAHEEYLSRNRKPAMRRVQAGIRRLIERRVMRSCRRVVTLSRYTAEKAMRAHGIPAERIEFIPGGVDPERFRPALDREGLRRRLGLEPGRRLLLTVRNLVPRMGLENLIAAMADIAPGVPEAVLWIGGEGPLREALEARTQALGLERRVRFLGFVPEETLPELYAAADLFVLPSLDLEGFGMVTLEALASGLPVLATPVGGSVEILSPLDRGLLLEGTSVEALGRGVLSFLHRLAADPQAGRRLSAACRRHAVGHYSWERHLDRLEALFQTIASPFLQATRTG